jgi:stress response protein SCP2
MDRVRELGDASVPFRFDVHALVFSDDAVGLEGKLHAALAEQRVNKVNQHREFFRTTPSVVRGFLAQAAGSHLLEFTETADALEWRASGAETTLAPLPPEPIRAAHPSEDDPIDVLAESSPAATARQLRDGQIVILADLRQLRLLLTADDSEIEIDPIAFLLNQHGVVRSDIDMVFYGQPDHPSGAVTLAADDNGAATALHICTDRVPPDVTEILLTAQVSGQGQVRVRAIDTESGPVGTMVLPAAGPTGLLQLGALHRASAGWTLQAQPCPMDLDIAGLATAAGVDIA